MRLVIVGGVAGGASAAARARRLSEDAEIVLVERGPDISYATCGIPYFVGGEVTSSSELLVQTPQAMRRRFAIDVRVRTEALRVDRETREIALRDLERGTLERTSYDALILATGALPLRPRLPGIERPGHFTLRTVADGRAVSAWIAERSARTAVIVGGGFIGLEMAEQLRVRGLEVTLVEALPQVMSTLDPEMASLLHAELRANGVDLRLGDAVDRFDAPERGARASTVALRGGARLPADIVVLALGVRPDVRLAREAGLEIGALGGIRVDERMRTSDPRIRAVGDAVEVRHTVTGAWSLISLAGPASRQGRIAADGVFGRDSRYPGTLGTGILRLFGLTAACTGATETMLVSSATPHHAVHLHPASHVGFYPGAAPMALKVLFSPDDGRLLGAQAVGRVAVDKRIDVLATALRGGMTVDDLAELELAYAPPFGSARDPINLAGMAAQSVTAGDVAQAHWREVASLDRASIFLLDVRDPAEWAEGQIAGAAHIPLGELRERLDEIPREREVVVFCRSGQRSYYACRILSQRGIRCRNLSGAYLTWRAGMGDPEH
ncbi:MAG: FAD-dependent oxidoreductase [Chthonomonadales bacterium]|nr:FAD-dependent oxidoreductase [Chthonomonadales bacterium]